MKTMPRWARSTSPSALSIRRCRMASISSLTYSVCASEVALAVTKGTLEHPRQRLAHQRLAGAGGADQQHVALDDVKPVGRCQRDLAVVGIDGDGKLALGLVLADDVLVEELDYLAGGHGGSWFRVWCGAPARLPAPLAMMSNACGQVDQEPPRQTFCGLRNAAGWAKGEAASSTASNGAPGASKGCSMPKCRRAVAVAAARIAAMPRPASR